MTAPVVFAPPHFSQYGQPQFQYAQPMVYASAQPAMVYQQDGITQPQMVYQQDGVTQPQMVYQQDGRKPA